MANMGKVLRTFAGVIALGFGASANAGPILSATSATINSGGPGFGTLTETFNQDGLLSGYTSGVTDFDTYIGTNPQHSNQFAGFEWFSSGLSASLTYNLGGLFSIDAVAFWNDGDSGTGMVDLFGSTDGVGFFSLSQGNVPTNNALFPATYGPDVFSFGAAAVQYVRMDLYSCPQPNGGGFQACALGEVAFRQGESSAVPAPATLALFGLGLAGLGWSRRKKV